MLFLNFLLSNSFNCAGATNVYGDPWILMNDGEYDFEKAITDAAELATDFNDETKSKARLYLYRFLKNNPEIISSEQVFIDFMDTYESTVLSGIFEVEEGLRNVEQYDSTIQALISATDSLINVFTDSIAYIYNNELEEEYAETLEYLYDQLNLMNQSLNNLYIIHEAYVNGELDSLNLRNDYLLSSEIPEQNNIFINEIYINYLEQQGTGLMRDYSFIENNYSSIFAVANQCPSAGGKAVFRARAMLELINDSIEYNDDIVCLQSGIYRVSELENKNIDFELIPNPATNQVSIELSNKCENDCIINIYNILGSLLKTEILNSESVTHTINLHNYNPGVYFVELKFNNYRRAKKLMVIK